MIDEAPKQRNEAELAEWHALWRDRLRRNDSFLDALALDGMKYSLISHAAILVLSFNAFTASAATSLKAVLLFAMVGAFVGIVMSALGHIILLESVSHFTEEARGLLIRRKSFRSAAALAVYGDRVMGRPIKWAARLIYGSMIWLCIYVFAALNMLGQYSV